MRVVRRIGWLTWLASILAATTLSLAVWTVSLTTQVAILTASAAAAAVNAAREKAEIKAKTKAKARLRRMLVAIPIAGTAAAIYFEQADFEEWLFENPGGTFSEYACIQADLSTEIVDEVLAELPEEAGLSADWLNQQQRTLCEEENLDSAHATAGSL